MTDTESRRVLELARLIARQLKEVAFVHEEHARGKIAGFSVNYERHSFYVQITDVGD